MLKLNLLRFEDRLTPTIFIVTSAADSGSGTLRAAFIAANATAGNDTIEFNIPGTAGISLASALPTITDTLIIDGRTQPGYDKTAKLPLIELIGNNLAVSGITVQAVNTQILGVNIHNFGVDGIRLESSGSLVEACFIGTDRTGKVDLGNGNEGISITGSSNTVRDSLISGNDSDGIQLTNAGASGNIIRGNCIGTDVTGTAALGNAKDGVHIHNAPLNTVGGGTTADRNIISANGRNTTFLHQGVHIDLDGSDNNTVIGNYIGTDITGSKDLGNGIGGGIRLDAGPDNTTIAKNVISGNEARGITIRDSGTNSTVVIGNIIGLNANGTAKIANDTDGLIVYDGPSGTRIGTDSDGLNDAAEGNVISGNADQGVELNGDTLTVPNTIIAGNLIGTNPLGDAALGNTNSGIYISFHGNGAVIRDNLLSGNGASGLNGFAADDLSIQGNRIGVNKAGTAALANADNGIELREGAANNTINGNLISGNGVHGLLITNPGSDANVVTGNIIGLNAAGNAAVPNGGNGVRNEGSASDTRIGTDGDGVNDAAEGNVISGNVLSGINISEYMTTGAVVAGNRIGTNAAGSLAIPNLGYGVTLEEGTFGNRVGTNGDGVADAVESNIISGNVLHGLRINSASFDNIVAGNRIGTNVNGTAALPNLAGGVWIRDGSTSNRIGTNADGLNDSAERNLISGNLGNGIEISEDPANFAPSRWLAAAGGNNHYYLLSPTATWTSAEAGAAAAGGHLADIANANEQSFVAGLFPAGSTRVWLGLNDRTTEGTYAWTTGAPVSYTRWSTNQPDNNKSIEDAVQMNADGRWNDYPERIPLPGFLEFNNPPDGIILLRNLSSRSNVIAGNIIGTDFSGTSPLGNSGWGVTITRASGNTIGGTAAFSGNVISNNLQGGVSVADALSTGNAIRRNSISGNNGLGIDRGGDGVSPAGLPVIASVMPGFSTRITGTAPLAGMLDFYGSTAADLTGYGEGERYLGSAGVPAGNFDILLPAATGANEVVTATLTDLGGNTTEFSQGRASFTTVAGLTVNNGAVQRSRVTSLEVRFNQTVAVTPAAFELKRTGDNAIVSVAVTLNGPVAAMSFLPGPAVESGSLADGRYTLTVLGANIPDFSGNDITFNSIYRLFGDANNDGTVNAQDFADFGNFFGQTLLNSHFDFNNDGTIDAQDLAEFGNRFGVTL